MLSIFRGDNLHNLAVRLLDELHADGLGNPLVPELFVVQNHGMAQWLSLFIAENEGVAANLDFKFPAEIFWEILRVMDPSIPETLPSERGPMSWALMEILQDDSDDSLQVLHQYISEDDPLREEMRCWQLANRIADVFDQYLTYRPELLLGWQRGKRYHHNSSERWQAALWEKLIRRWRNNGASSHRASLQNQLFEAIESQKVLAGQLADRITVFGVSTMPPVYLKLMVKLARLIDINIYTNAGEVSANHPLAQSFGTDEMEFQDLLKQYAREFEDTEIEEFTISSSKHPSNTLFDHFKKDLLNHDEKVIPTACDATLQVHSCHSRRREVEVLYDHLLAMLDEDETLNPSNILVMAPDIEPYRPEIEGVFGIAEESLPKLSYHFSERASGQHVVEQCFIKLLELADSRFKVTDVLDLLHCRPVKKRFNFTDADISTLEKWITDNNIRWGINGDQKTSFGVPPSNRFSWQSGLQRMMLGYAMNPQDDELYSGIYPYEEVESLENADLAGRFSSLMHALFNGYDQTQSPKTLERWSVVLDGWISEFLPGDEGNFRAIQRLRNHLSKLDKQQRQNKFEGEVSFPVIRSWLNDQFERQSTGGGRSGRGITFSSIMTMRNIPSRLICLVGLNDDSFPRKDNPVSFNLINQYPKPGDRRHNREDRGVFLQTLLATQQQLYVSFVGQSNRQDTDFPPSVILREWMDFVEEKFELKEEDLLAKERLQPFSRAYFTNDAGKKLFSYSLQNKSIAQKLLGPDTSEAAFLYGTLPEPETSLKKLTVDELIKFFTHPAKYFLQNRLGVSLWQNEIIDEDREVFNLNNLEEHNLGQKLLERYLNDKEINHYREVAFSRGFLPDNWPGEQAFNAKALEVQTYGERLQQALDEQKLDPPEVDLHFSEFTLAGRLQHIYPHEQAFFRFGRIRAKDLIKLWIKHLAFQTVLPEGHTGLSSFYVKGKKMPVEVHQLSPVDEPLPVLKKLVDLYWEGLQQNILFFCNTSFAYSQEVLLKGNSENSGLNKAKKEWKNEYSSYKREGEDPYNACLMNNDNLFAKSNLTDTFKQNSIDFWRPFFKVYKQR